MPSSADRRTQGVPNRGGGNRRNTTPHREHTFSHSQLIRPTWRRGGALQAGQPEQIPAWDTGEGEQTCAICSEELRGVVEVLGLCGHRFHRQCLEQWGLSQPGVFRGGDNAMPA
eukprot:2720252-Pyramimonas_sp.AAC.1